MFLNAEPQKTGVSLIASVALRIAALERAPRDLGVLEDQLDELVVVVRDLLEQVLARGLGRVGVLGGDVDDVEFLAEVVLVDDRLHPDEVDDARRTRPRRRSAAGSGRRCAPRRSIIVCTEPLEVRADAVHLVDERDARDVVLVGLAPDGLGLRLDAGDRVEQRDRAVEHAQRALDLDGEVDVAGRVDDVDAVVLPLARSSRPT